MTIAATSRLHIRHCMPADAPFLLRLLNTEGWLRFIGDRGLRTEEDALRYLENKIFPSYAKHGFGAYVLEIKESGLPIGMSTLVKRDHLEHVDLGYALLPEHMGKGYAAEASEAVMQYAREALGLTTLLAIVQPDNVASIGLLRKLGFGYERELIQDGERLEVYGRELG